MLIGIGTAVEALGWHSLTQVVCTPLPVCLRSLTMSEFIYSKLCHLLFNMWFDGIYILTRINLDFCVP